MPDGYQWKLDKVLHCLKACLEGAQLSSELTQLSAELSPAWQHKLINSNQTALSPPASLAETGVYMQTYAQLDVGPRHGMNTKAWHTRQLKFCAIQLGVLIALMIACAVSHTRNCIEPKAQSISIVHASNL